MKPKVHGMNEYKKFAGENPADVRKRHRAAGAALVRIKGDDFSGSIVHCRLGLVRLRTAARRPALRGEDGPAAPRRSFE